MAEEDIQPLVYDNETGMGKGLDYNAEITINVKDTEQFDVISKQISSKFYLGWERCKVTNRLRNTPYSVRKYRKGSLISKYHGVMKPLTAKYIHRVGFMFSNIDGEDMMSGELLDMKLPAYVKMLMGCFGSNCKPKDVRIEEVAKTFTVQLLEAMDYLHRRNIPHGKLIYDDVFVSRDHFFAVGTPEHAHLKLRLAEYETTFESYDALPSLIFGSHVATVPDPRSVTASVSDDCGHVVRLLTDLRSDLRLPDTNAWLRFKAFVNSQKYIDKALIMKHEGLWSTYAQMRFLRTLAPLWSSHVNKHLVQAPPFKRWVPRFLGTIKIMNGKLFHKAMKRKWYNDTLEGFSLMGKNALQHFNEYNQTFALSAEEFFESLICFDAELIPKLINVAKQLNLMETIMREICS